jgi:hypothetical protein
MSHAEQLARLAAILEKIRLERRPAPPMVAPNPVDPPPMPTTLAVVAEAA